MINREQLIKALEHCTADECNPDCPYYEVNIGCRTKIEIDALSLLKEQEPVEPNVSDINDHDAHGSWWYQCGKCKMPIDYGDRFCRHCGMAVKWNA